MNNEDDRDLLAFAKQDTPRVRCWTTNGRTLTSDACKLQFWAFVKCAGRDPAIKAYLVAAAVVCGTLAQNYSHSRTSLS